MQRLMIFSKFKNFPVKTEKLVGRIIPIETRSHPIIYQRFPETLLYKIPKCFLGSLPKDF